MKFKKTWCTLFGAGAGIVTVGLAGTAALVKSMCGKIPGVYSDLTSALFESTFGLSGEVSMNMTMPAMRMRTPLYLQNFTLNFQMLLGDDLTDQINEIVPSMMESTCSGAVWDAGLAHMERWLILLAVVGGASLIYQAITSKNEELLSLSKVNESCEEGGLQRRLNP